ncbi:MAG: VWA-like domain-containing protein [Actinocatenispora sp.]
MRTVLLAARMRAAAARPYLASALHALEIVPSTAVPTMGVDRYWRCYVNPAFVAATPVGELAAVWVHEVSHVLRNHHGRSDRLDPTGSAASLRLNVAADCEINDDLSGDGLPLPTGALLPAHFGLAAGRLFEEYARALPSYASVGWYECGSAAHGRPAPWELPGSGPVSDMEAAALRRQTARRISEHRCGRGDKPGGWGRWAQETLAPTVDWRGLLTGAVRGALGSSAGGGDYTYQRPSRRATALPGVVLPALRRRLPRVSIVIDTSGSVSDADLSTALGEVTGVLRSVGVRGNRVSILCCDARAGTARAVSTVEQVELVGGGGTDMRVGIAAAMAAPQRPDAVVLLTDGETPWPESAPPCRVVVGLLGHEYPWIPDWAETVRVGG